MKSYLVFFSLILFVAGCGKNEKDQFEEANRLVQEKKYSAAITAFEKVVKDFPTGENAPKASYEVAKLYHIGLIPGMDQTASQQKAVEYYQKVFVDYPKNELAPSALFMSGYIQANTLGKYNEATITYKKFLEIYPNSKFADDARSELDNMGLSPEEIIAKHQTQFTVKK
ncbi:MAG: tetratricopeptide repeat protein [Ignavibacteria bacterium]|nr:tetratricopeptide repeat protein [Ignavibacteria bacterium]